MNNLIRALATAAGAVAAVGVLASCSSTTTEGTSTNAAPMPNSATFVADMAARDGATMTMAIAVEDDKVVAYVTDGTTDEAEFVGTQQDGRMDLMSPYGDNLTATFDGTSVTGEVTMNVAEVAPVTFEASPVSAPAGLYTASQGNSRAMWVVRPDRTMVGMMSTRAPGHLTVADVTRAQDQAFKDSVRQMRLDRQLRQAPQMDRETMTMDMDGTTMTATRVTGDMSI